VLFLSGLGRSGTTILERVLGELPGVCSAGELVHLWQRGVLDDELCGCGEPFSRCRFWTEVGRRAFGGWDRGLAERMLHLRLRVDRTRHVLLAAVPAYRRRERAEYVAVFARLYRAIVETSGCPVVIDSSKHSSMAYCLRTSSDIDLRVLHVVRDSRGVAYSWTKEVRRPEAGGTDLMTQYSPGRSALLWTGHNVALSLLRLTGATRRLVRYEDFVADPAATVTAVAGFAGVGTGDGPAFLSGSSVELGRSHTVAGNPVRFRTGTMTLRRDDDWRRLLPRRTRHLVTALTLPLLAGYGYLGRFPRSSR
jgi:Sulfotransferase family